MLIVSSWQPLRALTCGRYVERVPHGVGGEGDAGVDLVMAAEGDRLERLRGGRRDGLVPAVGVGGVARVQVQGWSAGGWRERAERTAGRVRSRERGGKVRRRRRVWGVDTTERNGES